MWSCMNDGVLCHGGPHTHKGAIHVIQGSSLEGLQASSTHTTMHVYLALQSNKAQNLNVHKDIFNAQATGVIRKRKKEGKKSCARMDE